MKHADIETGRAYMLRVTIPGTPKITVRRRVTVVDTTDRQVVVEHLRPQYVNLDDFALAEQPRAMIDGKLRCELRPVQLTVRAADIIAPAADAGAER